MPLDAAPMQDRVTELVEIKDTILAGVTAATERSTPRAS